MNLRLLGIAMIAGCVALGAAAGRAEDRKADPRAMELMRSVYEKREGWGPDFPGFRANATVVFNGKESHGKVRVARDYNVSLELGDKAAADWAMEALGSVVLHRKAVRFEEADGKYPLTLGELDSHPSGRLVQLNDGMNSTYRVRDGQILQVNRSAGPKMRFSIDIVENIKTESGKYLPRVFTVSYFRTPGGELERTDTYWDGYKKVGKYYLPEFRREVTAEDGKTQAMQLKLDDLSLL